MLAENVWRSAGINATDDEKFNFECPTDLPSNNEIKLVVFDERRAGDDRGQEIQRHENYSKYNDGLLKTEVAISRLPTQRISHKANVRELHRSPMHESKKYFKTDRIFVVYISWAAS